MRRSRNYQPSITGTFRRRVCDTYTNLMLRLILAAFVHAAGLYLVFTSPSSFHSGESLYIKHDELFSWKGDIDNALSLEYLRLFYSCEESSVSTHPGTLRQVSRLPCESSLPHAYVRLYFLSFLLPLELSRLPAPVNLLRPLLTRRDQGFLTRHSLLL